MSAQLWHVEADPNGVSVAYFADSDDVLTPEEARAFAADLLRAADGEGLPEDPGPNGDRFFAPDGLPERSEP